MENRPLVLNQLKFETSGNFTSLFERNLLNLPQFSKEKPQDVNMEPAGPGNTRISTDYKAQKSPPTLDWGSSQAGKLVHYMDQYLVKIFGHTSRKHDKKEPQSFLIAVLLTTLICNH